MSELEPGDNIDLEKPTSASEVGVDPLVMNDAEFVSDMRSYELEYEPDGWPAVQMYKITRLLDIIDRQARAIEEPSVSDLALANRRLRRIHAILTDQAIEWRDINGAVRGYTARLNQQTFAQLMNLSNGLNHDES